MSEPTIQKAGITRRSFLKTTAAVAGATAAIGGTGTLTALAQDFDSGDQADQDEDVFVTVCRSNCSQGCVFNVYTREGKACRMTPRALETDLYTGSCLRGMSLIERTYSPTRIQYPMRRVGERGAGEWERITWDEAFDEIGGQFKAIQEKYGNQALMVSRYTGNYANMNGAGGFPARFANAVEGTFHGYSVDQAFEYCAFRVNGTFAPNETLDAVNSKNIIIWGANTVWTSPQTWRGFMAARDNGAKITVIDPIFSASAAKADRYIPCKAGKDGLIALALLNRVLQNGDEDTVFCQTRTTAPFLVRRDNHKILRKSDFDDTIITADDEGGSVSEFQQLIAARRAAGEAVAVDDYYVWDPATGSAAFATECSAPALYGSYDVNGVAVDTVLTLLRDRVKDFSYERAIEESGLTAEDMDYLYDVYTQGGPLWVACSYGIDHYYNGHLWSYAASILSDVTGNIAKPGAAFGSLWNSGLHISTNPDFTAVEGHEASSDMVANAARETIKTGTYKGEKFPIKAVFIATNNPVSNAPDQNDFINEVLPNLELIVTADIEYTDTVKYSDYVLPVSFWLEQEDVRVDNGIPYIVISEKGLDNLYETKTDHEIFTGLAKAMGLSDAIPDQPASEWIELIMDSPDLAGRGITYKKLKDEKAIRLIGSQEKPFVQSEDSFPTDSGRAELYCESPVTRYDYGQEWESYIDKERLPYWEDTIEVANEELREKYPLQFLQVHTRWTTHSQWFGNESFLELRGEPVLYLSPGDMERRGLSDDDVVRVFNDNGQLVVKCVTHNGLQEGIAWIPKGWQSDQFIDGNYQELTHLKLNPMSVNYNLYDVLVEVEKAV